jgi:hypothetical protein
MRKITMREPLPKAEVIKAIEHGRPSRVPMMLHFWTGAQNFGDRAEQVREIQAQYPHDMHPVGLPMPQMWDDPSQAGAIPGYSWMNTPPPPAPTVAKGHDANFGIEDWSQLQGILDSWPSPDAPASLGSRDQIAKDAAGRYVLACWWFCFYERIWSMRGMENVMMDFYLNPKPLHQLMEAMCDFYCGMIRRARKEIGADGVFTSDDIGMQTGPMFSHEIFLEFFKPLYAKVFKAARDNGMHFWLHTCGDVRLFMDDLIEVGLDVIHPIQKYTMSEQEIAKRFGGRICFWTGMDVQQILPKGTPEDVRREVRFMIDTYDRPDGGCMITAGNGVTPDVPVANLLAFHDEAYEYGLKHRQTFGK